MNLERFYHKKVKIIARNGLAFIGKVNDYIEPEDNDEEKACIIIDTPSQQAIGFTEDDIASIEVLEK